MTALTLGAVTLGSPSYPSETVVGAPPQWSDDSDDTYAFMGKVFVIGQPSAGNATAPVEPVAGNLVSWSVALRLKSTPGFGSDPTEMQVILHDGADGFTDAFNIEVPTDGTIYEVTANGVIYPENNPDGWLAGPNVQCQVNIETTFNRVTVYQVDVDVTLDRRRFCRNGPRDDGENMSSAARNYPPTKARRNFGGYR